MINKIYCNFKDIRKNSKILKNKTHQISSEYDQKMWLSKIVNQLMMLGWRDFGLKFLR